MNMSVSNRNKGSCSGLLLRGLGQKCKTVLYFYCICLPLVGRWCRNCLLLPFSQSIRLVLICLGVFLLGNCISSQSNAQTIPAPTNISVTPGVKQLSVSWSFSPPACYGDGFRDGFEVQYRQKGSTWRDAGFVLLDRDATPSGGVYANDKINGALEIYKGSSFTSRSVTIGNFDANDGVRADGADLADNQAYEVRVYAFSFLCTPIWSAPSSIASATTLKPNPTVSISGIPKATNEAVEATFTFSKNVTGFVNGDISLKNATASNFSGSGSSYTATITPINDGEFSVGVDENVAQDAALNFNTAAATVNGTYDTTRPSVRITGVPTSTNQAFTATFTFSENVTGFVDEDISLTNATTSNFTGSGTTYSATITPINDGEFSVGVDENVAQDAALNFNTAAATVNGTYDTTRPSVRITGVPTSTNQAFTATFTFSENVTGFVDGDISLTNATASNFTGSGTTYSATITPTNEGSLSVSVAENVAQDSAGNFNTASTKVSTSVRAVDSSSRPSVNITGIPSATNQSFTATFTFSENVTGFVEGDISLTNATTSNFTGSGTTYSATITPINDGEFSVGVDENVAQDAALNFNTAAATVNGTYDTTRPSVRITGVPTSTNQAFTATFTFSENVTGFVDGDISLTNATVSNFTGSGTTYTATITPTNQGSLSISVAENVAQDNAGNSNLAAKAVTSNYDSVRPTISISGIPIATDKAVTATFTFSESVTGFVSEDIFLTNATVSNFTGSGSLYTATITPTNQGNFTVGVNENVAQDNENNLNLAAETVNSIYNTSRPLVFIGGIPAVTNQAITATFTFSKSVTGFEVEDISLTNATASNFTGSGSFYSATITPKNEGTFTVGVPKNVAQDSNNNFNLAAETVNSIYNTSRPLVTITGIPAMTNQAVTATFTFTESVTGFEVEDISLTNSTASNFVGSGAIYTAIITPINEGSFTVGVDASVAQNANNKFNLAAKTVRSIYNTSRPSVMISGVPPMISKPIIATFTFSRSVSGFTIEDISTNQATVSNFSGSATTYTATITPTVEGTFTISVLANVAQDEDGNFNTAAISVISIYYIDNNLSLKSYVKGWITRFGRTVGEQLVAAIQSRINSLRQSSGVRIQIAGETLPEIRWGDSNDTNSITRNVKFQKYTQPKNVVTSLGQETDHQVVTDQSKILNGTNFEIVGLSDSGATVGLWGRGSFSRYKGVDQNLFLNGDVFTWSLGTDWRRDGLMLGMIISQSQGKSSYTFDSKNGNIQSDMTSFAPYWGLETTDGRLMWASVGIGDTKLKLTPNSRNSIYSDGKWGMVAAGLEGKFTVLNNQNNFDMGWSIDGLWTHISANATEEFPYLEGETSRMRMVANANWEHKISNSSIVRPRVELGIRLDGGDAETGVGAEFGAGLEWVNPKIGLNVLIDGRTVFAHQNENFKNWGIGVSAAYDPKPRTKKGFSANLSATANKSTYNEPQNLLNPTSVLESIEMDKEERTVSVSMAYGQKHGEGHLVGSTYTAFGTQKRQTRIGYRIEPDEPIAEDVNVDVWTKPLNNGKKDVAGITMNWKW